MKSSLNPNQRKSTSESVNYIGLNTYFKLIDYKELALPKADFRQVN